MITEEGMEYLDGVIPVYCTRCGERMTARERFHADTHECPSDDT